MPLKSRAIETHLDLDLRADFLADVAVRESLQQCCATFPKERYSGPNHVRLPFHELQGGWHPLRIPQRSGTCIETEIVEGTAQCCTPASSSKACDPRHCGNSQRSSCRGTKKSASSSIRVVAATPRLEVGCLVHRSRCMADGCGARNQGTTGKWFERGQQR
jgi:hypothetical protein